MYRFLGHFTSSKSKSPLLRKLDNQPFFAKNVSNETLFKELYFFYIKTINVKGIASRQKLVFDSTLDSSHH